MVIGYKTLGTSEIYSPMSFPSLIKQLCLSNLLHYFLLFRNIYAYLKLYNGSRTVKFGCQFFYDETAAKPLLPLKKP